MNRCASASLIRNTSSALKSQLCSERSSKFSRQQPCTAASGYSAQFQQPLSQLQQQATNENFSSACSNANDQKQSTAQDFTRACHLCTSLCHLTLLECQILTLLCHFTLLHCAPCIIYITPHLYYIYIIALSYFNLLELLYCRTLAQ